MPAEDTYTGVMGKADCAREYGRGCAMLGQRDVEAVIADILTEGDFFGESQFLNGYYEMMCRIGWAEGRTAFLKEEGTGLTDLNAEKILSVRKLVDEAVKYGVDAYAEGIDCVAILDYAFSDYLNNYKHDHGLITHLYDAWTAGWHSCAETMKDRKQRVTVNCPKLNIDRILEIEELVMTGDEPEKDTPEHSAYMDFLACSSYLRDTGRAELVKCLGCPGLYEDGPEFGELISPFQAGCEADCRDAERTVSAMMKCELSRLRGYFHQP